MSELKHTPRPWECAGPVERDAEAVKRFPPLKKEFWEIGQVGDIGVPGVAGVNSEADARLIAAAPDLLAAAVQLVTDIDHGLIGPGSLERTAAIRAAIAKAVGE